MGIHFSLSALHHSLICHQGNFSALIVKHILVAPVENRYNNTNINNYPGTYYYQYVNKHNKGISV